MTEIEWPGQSGSTHYTDELNLGCSWFIVSFLAGGTDAVSWSFL